MKTYNRNAITNSGYTAIYKDFKGAIEASGKGFKVGCLPNPNQINKLRREMNDNLKELIGEYYSITDNLIVKPNLRAKSQDPVKVSLNEMNSFFVVVEAV